MLRAVTTPERAAAVIGDLVQSKAGPLGFWVAISSNLLHAITPPIIGLAVGAFLFQFFVFLIPATALTYCLNWFVISVDAWHWCSVVLFLSTQLLTGLWIASAKQQRFPLVCLLVVFSDCATGFLNLNNVSINMAIWSVPVLLGTIIGRRLSRDRCAEASTLRT